MITSSCSSAITSRTGKSLRAYGERVSADIRGQIESALNNLKDTLKSDEGDRIRKAIDNLNTVSQKLAEEMYKTGAGQTAGAAAGSDRATAAGGDAAASAGAKKDEDVIDAEYEVKEGPK